MYILKEELFTDASANGINTLLIDAVNKKWESIDDFNSLIVNLQEENFDDMIPIVEKILEDEHNHIGQLQQLMEQISPMAGEIEVGKEEALELLEDDFTSPEPIGESLITESFEKDVYDWLERNYASEREGVDWKPRFKQYIDRIKSSGYNTTNLTKDVNIAIKKFAKQYSIKPQKIMSALQESLRNTKNIERNTKLAKKELANESLKEGIDENADKYYVSYYEEVPAYHPEEGGYYVATCWLEDSEEFDNLEDARRRIAELATEQDIMEKMTDEFYIDKSKYIGGDRFYIIETEQGSEEKGDEPYQ